MTGPQAKEALAAALHSVFLVGLPIAAAGLVLAFLLPEHRLKTANDE